VKHHVDDITTREVAAANERVKGLAGNTPDTTAITA
jgi:hypothetical protein